MKTIAILYGGKSGEHEVSLISAASIVQNLDPNLYTILPIGITKTGEWLLQDWAALRQALDKRSGMEGLPSVQSGKRVFVLPGKGLVVENSARGWEKLDCDIVFPVLTRNLRRGWNRSRPFRMRRLALCGVGRARFCGGNG